MVKLVAMAMVLVTLGCGQGSNAAAPPRPGRTQATVVEGPCTNTPEDCGVKICIDCTADAPPGTEAACVTNRCVYACAAGFHQCAARGCFSNDDADHCGPECQPCGALSGGTPICTAGTCDFRCDTGFAKIGAACVSLSFSISY